jgi:hypothetical protein
VIPDDYSWLDFPMTEAVPYIRDQLSFATRFSHRKGETTLANYLLQLPLEQGHILPYIFPKYLEHVDPEHGAESAIAQAKPDKEILSVIRSYLTGQRRYAVLDDCSSTPDGYQDSDKKFFLYGSRVYLYLSSQDRDDDYIHKVLRTPVPYPLVGILSSLPGDVPEIENRHEVTLSFLQSLADGTTHLIIGAFDACGYLLWHRPD